VVPAGSRPPPVVEKSIEPVIAKAEFPSLATKVSDGTPQVVRLKYEMCKNWRTKGACPYAEKCLFAHGENELSRRTTAPTPAPVVVVEPTTEVK
jgi:hypothetical protein